MLELRDFLGQRVHKKLSANNSCILKRLWLTVGHLNTDSDKLECVGYLAVNKEPLVVAGRTVGGDERAVVAGQRAAAAQRRPGAARAPQRARRSAHRAQRERELVAQAVVAAGTHRAYNIFTSNYIFTIYSLRSSTRVMFY